MNDKLDRVDGARSCFPECGRIDCWRVVLLVYGDPGPEAGVELVHGQAWFRRFHWWLTCSGNL